MAEFTKTKYEADDASIYSIRLTAAYAAAAGAPPGGAVNRGVKAKVSKTSREFGLRPRGVTLGRKIGTGGDTASKYTFLAVLTATAFNGTGFSLGTEITLDSVVWEVVGRQAEDFN